MSTPFFSQIRHCPKPPT